MLPRLIRGQTFWEMLDLSTGSARDAGVRRRLCNGRTGGVGDRRSIICDGKASKQDATARLSWGDG